MKGNQKKNKLGIDKTSFAKVFLIVGCLILIGLFTKGYLYKNEIKNNESKTICKYVFCKQYPKTSSNFFRYYVGNVLYRNDYGRCPKNFNKKINKFFEMSYSNDDPNKIIVDFSKEVKDTVIILRAGFAKEDIE